MLFSLGKQPQHFDHALIRAERDVTAIDGKGDAAGQLIERPAIGFRAGGQVPENRHALIANRDESLALGRKEH